MTPAPPRIVALTVLGIALGIAVAFAVLFASPPTACHPDGSCDALRLRERVALASAAVLGASVLALAFLAPSRSWRGWLLLAGVPLALMGGFWLALAAGAGLENLDRPVLGADPPCNDTGDGLESSKCAGDPFTWGSILLVAGYVGLGALAVLVVKALLLLALPARPASPS